jgi:hypothetical protein
LAGRKDIYNMDYLVSTYAKVFSELEVYAIHAPRMAAALQVGGIQAKEAPVRRYDAGKPSLVLLQLDTAITAETVGTLISVVQVEYSLENLDGNGNGRRIDQLKALAGHIAAALAQRRERLAAAACAAEVAAPDLAAPPHICEMVNDFVKYDVGPAKSATFPSLIDVLDRWYHERVVKLHPGPKTMCDVHYADRAGKYKQLRKIVVYYMEHADAHRENDSIEELQARCDALAAKCARVKDIVT